MTPLRSALQAARRHPVLGATALAAALAVVYLLWVPQTLDLSAQTYRAELWEREGFVLWSPEWYGGFSVPGYSLLFPPLGAWLGPALVGAIAAVAAAALFASIATRAYGASAWIGVYWFAAASLVAPLGGRVTFALGLAIGLGCVSSVQRRRAGSAAVLGALASLASPVAGLFTALGCAAVLVAARAPASWIGVAAAPAPRPAAEPAGSDLPVRAAGSGAAGATVALGLLALAFPTAGFQPFALSAWIWIPLAVAALLVLTGSREYLVLRWAAVLYLLAGTAALLVQTPLGGNAARLGLTLAGPLLAIVLWRSRRPVLLALLALPLLWWQWTATVRDVTAASGDPSTTAAYYEPLRAELDRIELEAGPVTVEVPPTRNRWESAYLAPEHPLARGWLRQLEADDIATFEQLSSEGYRSWLTEHGVSYVALSDADPDYIAASEVELIEAGLPYLRPLWSDAHWSLYAVEGEAGGSPKALRTGEGELLELGPDHFTVRVGPGGATFALRYSPFFDVAAPGVCVERAETPGAGTAGMTRITIADGTRKEGGRIIEVRAELSLEGLLGRDRHCAG